MSQTTAAEQGTAGGESRMSPHSNQEANLKHKDEERFVSFFKQIHGEANYPEIAEDLAKMQMALKSA